MNEEIRVVWNCHMGEACSNTERPGVHEGDDGYNDARRCRGEYVGEDKTSIRIEEDR